MGLWKRLSRAVHARRGAREDADVGVTYADLERDKERKERLLSIDAEMQPEGRRGRREED